MATSGSKFAGNVPGWLLVMAVLAGTCAPGAHALLIASLVNVTFTNELHWFLNVTSPAPPLGSAQSVVIRPDGSRMIKLEPLEPQFVYTVRNVEYSTVGSPISRAAAESGAITVLVSAPCQDGVPGLQITIFTLDLLETTDACATPVTN